MKRFWLALTLVLLCVLSLHAQGPDLAGTWQGTLAAGPKGLRIVLKIVHDGSGYKTIAYSIDQSPQPVTAKSTTLSGTEVKVEVPAFGGSYTGKLGPDGNTITGTFEAGQLLPLNLVRATPETAFPLPEASAPIPPMPKDAKPSFEVATIKPSNPDNPGKAIAVQGRKCLTRNTTVDDLVEFAYKVQARQIVNAQPWMATDHFDVEGTPDVAGTPDTEQLRGMLQRLLADRFALAFHAEKRDLQAYVLTVAKAPGVPGSKLSRSAGDPNGLPGLFFGIRNGVVLHGTNANMEDLADLLQEAVVDRPVVNATALVGRYDFVLSFTPDDSMMNGLSLKLPPTPEGKEAPPNLFTAMQTELGLKLDAEKTQVSVLAIDKVAKPSGN